MKKKMEKPFIRIFKLQPYDIIASSQEIVIDSNKVATDSRRAGGRTSSPWDEDISF